MTRPMYEFPFCACGCGERTANRRDKYRMACYYLEVVGKPLPPDFYQGEDIYTEHATPDKAAAI